MYRGRLERDLSLWVGKGLLTEQTADSHAAGIRQAPGKLQPRQCTDDPGGILLAAAILLVVASNWEAIPRLVQVCLHLALIWAVHLGAAAMLAVGRSPPPMRCWSSAP
jgi:uncharacterized membrane protein